MLAFLCVCTDAVLFSSQKRKIWESDPQQNTQFFPI